MRAQQFTGADGTTRSALMFGSQKINLHQAGGEFDSKAKHPTPGSADLCFLNETTIERWITHLEHCNVPIEEGPVQRTGACFAILSIYVRDPDYNLIEISTQLPSDF